jgi:hypothetical protein
MRHWDTRSASRTTIRASRESRMKLRHAAALALGVMLSSCGYVQWGPTAGDLRLSELEYQKCLRTSDSTSECANERQLRNFNYQFAFHSEPSCQPGARTEPN